MRAIVWTLLLASAIYGGIPLYAAQAPYYGDDIIVPESSVEHEGDRGVRAHTNHLLYIGPAAGLGPSGGITPAQIQSFYNSPASGGSGVIAIVDAYNYPTALNDFNVFASEFGLPQETSTVVTASTNKVFQIVYANGRKPTGNTSWNQEEALDIEWAHAMAPGAKIVLVEANSSNNGDLFAAVSVARSISGVKEISMSWGGAEASGETSYDSYFPQSNGIVYWPRVEM